MRLYLVQHGEAKSEAEDPERPLSDRGAQTVQRAARWLSHADVAIAQIRHSGKRRAEQTADILAEHLRPANGVRAVAGLQPMDDILPLAASLESETKPLMIVGHLPFLNRLAGQLVASDPEATVVRFTNAGIVCLRREDDRWSVDWALPPRLMS